MQNAKRAGSTGTNQRNIWISHHGKFGNPSGLGMQVVTVVRSFLSDAKLRSVFITMTNAKGIRDVCFSARTMMQGKKWNCRQAASQTAKLRMCKSRVACFNPRWKANSEQRHCPNKSLSY